MRKIEIYIDNEKISLGKRNQKNFERIIKVISKKLEKNEKIIRNIYINGNILEDNTVIDMDKPNILEVETKSYVDLIIESLENSRAYIDIFFEIIFFLNIKMENKEKILKEDIDEIHNFLMWFNDLMYLIEETYDFSIYLEFENFLNKLDENINLLVEKRKKKKYEEYTNILEENIASLLENFFENINFYYNKIIEEEKKKKLVV